MAATSPVDEIAAQLAAAGDPEYAANLRWFFKAEPGGYGEGDQFRGVRVPQVRAVCRSHRGIAVDQLEVLLQSPWHEDRLAAAILMAQEYPRGDAERRSAIYEVLLANTERLNNWDLVDQCAPHVVGAHLDVVGSAVLDRLAVSPIVWERRIAIVATADRISRGESDDALRIAERLLGDEHPLIHKAVGWMLREVGKRVDRDVLLVFLEAHAAEMAAVTLSYATEHLSAEQRAHFRSLRRAGR